MSPVHRTPHCAVRIILVKEVIHPIVKYHAIGVVHPIFRRRKMNLRTMRFCIKIMGRSLFVFLFLYTARIRKNYKGKEKYDFNHLSTKAKHTLKAIVVRKSYAMCSYIE